MNKKLPETRQAVFNGFTDVSDGLTFIDTPLVKYAKKSPSKGG